MIALVSPKHLPFTALNPKRWECVLRRLPVGPVVGAELGVWVAIMSRALLEARRDLHLWLVDIHFKSEVDALPQDRITKLLGTTKSQAQHAPNAYFDFVFIDADHRYNAVKQDIQLWKPKVRPGGWLCGHDFHKHYPDGGVSKAVEELCPGFELDTNDTWFLRV